MRNCCGGLTEERCITMTCSSIRRTILIATPAFRRGQLRIRGRVHSKPPCSPPQPSSTTSSATEMAITIFPAPSKSTIATWLPCADPQTRSESSPPARPLRVAVARSKHWWLNNFRSLKVSPAISIYCSYHAVRSQMVSFSRSWVVVLLLAVFPLSGCLFHTRKVVRQVNYAALKTSTKPELIAYINSQAAKIQSMQATVDIDTAVGGVKKGKVTEYQQIRGYVLARKPAMLRMIGLLPILRNTAFDMVSDGREFKVSIPPKNRFVVGRNDLVTPNPQQPKENVRSQVIYNAFVLLN